MASQEIFNIIEDIYNALQKPVYKMTISERCELQKLLNKAIRMDSQDCFLNKIDRFNFEHHSGQFEADIFLIESKIKERVLTQTAAIQIAIDRISDIWG